jgi:hypothetical protein
VNFLLRLAGSYVDAVLNTFYPREPSMADLSAERLADKEALEEVMEPRVRGGFKFGYLRDPEPDPVDHMIALLEDIRNLLQAQK